MKNKILFIFICLFVLLIGVNKVGATVIYEDENVTIDEEFIYNAFNSIDGYSFLDNKNILCNYTNSSSSQYPNLTCYSMSDDFISHLHYVVGSGKMTIRPKENLSDIIYYYFYYSLKRHEFDSLTSYSSVTAFTNFEIYTNSYSPFSYVNFDLTKIEDIPTDKISNVKNLDFSSYEEPELEEYQIENKIYLPIELEENMCPYILDKDTIRVYDETPTQNSTVTYTDYFVNSHYISKSGSESFENDVLMCLDKSKFTTAFYYRFDFDKIMIIFISMLTIVYVIFGKIVHSFFIGFRR